MKTPEVIQGDITKLEVDAAVNAANNHLQDGAGVNGAIFRAAGPELARACAVLGGCDTGDAKVTPGFQLPARYVFHTVGPVWSGGDKNEDALLASCYRRCMSLAREHDINSIAFPAISCGIFGFPVERAIPIAIKTVQEHWQSAPALERVIFCCFDEAVAAQYRAALNQ